MAKGKDLQKILVGGAAGAVIGGAATYAATHRKETKKALDTALKITNKAVKKVDTQKAKELADVAISRFTKPSNSMGLKNGRAVRGAAKKMTTKARKTVGRKTATKRRTSK